MGIFKNLKSRLQVSRLLREYCSYIGRTDEVAKVNSMHLAILLDELEVWKYYEYIPFQSYKVAAVMPGVPSISDIIRMLARNREHLEPTRGRPYKDEKIVLKHRVTGIINDKNPY